MLPSGNHCLPVSSQYMPQICGELHHYWILHLSNSVMTTCVCVCYYTQLRRVFSGFINVLCGMSSIVPSCVCWWPFAVCIDGVQRSEWVCWLFMEVMGTRTNHSCVNCPLLFLTLSVHNGIMIIFGHHCSPAARPNTFTFTLLARFTKPIAAS